MTSPEIDFISKKIQELMTDDYLDSVKVVVIIVQEEDEEKKHPEYAVVGNGCIACASELLKFYIAKNKLEHHYGEF